MDGIRIASIKGYRRKGRAIVTIERSGRSARRHQVSLRRYRAFKAWLAN